MSTDYYTRSFDVTPGNRVGSQVLENEFALLATGLAKLPSLAQLWGNSANYAVAGGAVNVYTATVAATYLTAYADGLTLLVKFGTTNTTTTPTLNLNSLGAKTITRADGTALAVGELTGIVPVAYSTAAGTFLSLAGGAAAAAAAAASASAANVSALDAAAALDIFDDIFLGAKAANPTLDNDGNALQMGALYFNTVAGEMRVYSGSAWAAAYVPGSTYVAKSGDTMTGALNWGATVTIASAASVAIGAAASNDLIISGTTTITSFDSIAAGASRKVKFTGALTLTHNATSLILPGAASITTANGDTAQFTSLGSGNWKCDWYSKANGQAVVAAAGSSYLYLREQQASGTHGPDFISGAWRTRTLNTTLANTITGASVATNQITLPAGTYEVYARAPAYAVGQHKAKLWNVTDSADVLIGASAFSGAADSTETDSIVMGVFTIAASKTFELQHRCTTNAGAGMGQATSYAVVEIYAEIQIHKVA